MKRDPGLREFRSRNGDAGEIELIAEDVALSLGLLDEFQEAVRDNKGSIAYFVTRIDPATGRLRNGRATCPCGRADKRGRLKLRRDCWKADELCLPLLERDRRNAEKAFWRSYIGKMACCGTIDDCPLKYAHTK